MIGLNIDAVTHRHTQQDSNMWSGRNPYNGSAESQDAQSWKAQSAKCESDEDDRHVFEVFQLRHQGGYTPMKIVRWKPAVMCFRTVSENTVIYRKAHTHTHTHTQLYCFLRRESQWARSFHQFQCAASHWVNLTTSLIWWMLLSLYLQNKSTTQHRSTVDQMWNRELWNIFGGGSEWLVLNDWCLVWACEKETNENERQRERKRERESRMFFHTLIESLGWAVNM